MSLHLTIISCNLGAPNWVFSACLNNTSIKFQTSEKLMSRSHQTFRSVLAVKLLGIMLRNRWWPTTFLPEMPTDGIGTDMVMVDCIMSAHRTWIFAWTQGANWSDIEGQYSWPFRWQLWGLHKRHWGIAGIGGRIWCGRQGKWLPTGSCCACSLTRCLTLILGWFSLWWLRSNAAWSARASHCSYIRPLSPPPLCFWVSSKNLGVVGTVCQYLCRKSIGCNFLLFVLCRLWSQ